MEAVTASPQQLMDQAGMTAHDYLLKMVETIDRVFGEGYAKCNPELVGAMVLACTRDFHTSMFTQAAGEFLHLSSTTGLGKFPSSLISSK